MQPPPPLAAPHSSSSASLFVVSVAVLGILTTSAFLLSYYIFVIKCCLNWRRSDVLLRLFSASRRRPFPSDAPAESTGLDPSAIRAIPTFIHSSVPAASSAAECAVCLTEFHGGERLSLLPGCAHAFHIDCVDRWLQSNTSCPLCRARITCSPPPPADYSSIPAQSSAIDAGGEAPENPGRKLEHAVSMGDECVEARREKDELFAGQPLRRSLSLDSSCHRQLYISVQEILRWNPDLFGGEEAGNAGGGGGGGGVGGSGRARRPFFPFGYGRNPGNAVQPADLDV